MAAQCFNCGKGVMYGHNVSHAKNRTRKIFKPNLHSARIDIRGMSKKVKLCTKCLRSLRKSNVFTQDEPQVVVAV
jgi:large subunit ribosomal protein L28